MRAGGAKVRGVGVALGLLVLIGCAEVDRADAVTSEGSTAERVQVASKQGMPDRRAGHDRVAGRRRHAVVTRVVDGDTVELGNGKTVRLIGIDTPEVYGGTDCGGPQASAFMKRIATGRRVSVRTDPTQDRYDRYGRLLAYLDAGGRDLGGAVVRAGWARVYVYDQPFQRLAAYRRAASRARGGERGIWGRCAASGPGPGAESSPDSAPAPPSGPDKDCADFASQSEAQRYLLAGDPHRLDGDGDGIACDSLD